MTEPERSTVPEPQTTEPQTTEPTPQPTTEPERSFGRYFSRAGRLENAWAAALAHSDPARALERLRGLYHRFERRPADAAALWLPFQASVLDPRFATLLTDDDFAQLANAGHQLAIAAGGGLTESWSPLIQQALARRTPVFQERAYTLLTGLYWSSLTSDDVRRNSAAALAGFEAVGEAQLALYADVASLPQPIPEVMALIGRILQVGFEDGDLRLGQAFSLASKLAAAMSRVDAVFALALGELLLHRRPRAALPYFQAMRTHEASNAEALRGMIAAHMHAGEFSAAVDVAAGTAAFAAGTATATAETKSDSPRCTELLALCRQLAWLDAPQSLTEADAPDDSPPHTAAELAGIAPGRDTGPWLDYAIGRSHLLEGEAEQARSRLTPLPAHGLSGPDALYHAAWAHLLCQDAASVRAAFDAAAGRPGSWALGCMLQDAEPGLAMAGLAPFVPLPFQPAAQARETLVAQGAVSAPVGLVALDIRSATRPDLFEALRTALGVAVARDDAPMLNALIRQPLFSRLPAAERLLWTGLAARTADPGRARHLLRHALALGRSRAALILAVDALDDGRPDEARQLLHGVTGPKAALILAWIDARTAALPQAVERFETLAGHGIAHADYALGLLALRDAAGSWARGTPELATARAEQAVHAFTTASRHAPQRFAPAPLISAARLLQTTPAPNSSLPWQEFTAQPWILRQLAFSRLVHAPAVAQSPLLHEIAAWATPSRPPARLRSGPRRPFPQSGVAAPEYVALAEAILRVALLTEDSAICEQASALLSGLAERFPAAEIRIAARRAAAFAALRAGKEIPEAETDPLIALAAMGTVFDGEYRFGRSAVELAEAVRILNAAASDYGLNQQPDSDGAYRALVALLADALGHGRLPERLPIALPARVESALALAAAVGAVDEEEISAQILLRALRTADVNDLVDLERALAALCTQVAKQRGSKRDASAAALAPTVLRAAETAGEPGGLGNHSVARYATVVGEFEAADRLWLRALHDAKDDAVRLPLLREEYGRFLCHRAVLAHLSGRRPQMFEYLRMAAACLPEPAGRILRQLEADERVKKLVVSLFPDSPLLGRQRTGRYQSLDRLIAADAGLRAALERGEREQIIAQWRAAADGDIELWHTVAVLSREDALARQPGTPAALDAGIRATALWMLLLAEPALRKLFGDRPHAAEAEALLRGQLLDELLTRQKALLTEAVARRDLPAVRAHVRCLDSVRQGTAATRSLIPDDFAAIGARIGIEDEFAPISERAMALLGEWGAERVAAGRLRLDGRPVPKRRSRAVVADYGAAIEEVEIVARLGLGLKDVHRVALEWHNGWLQSLAGVQDKSVGAQVVRSAQRFADILAPMCTPGQTQSPEVRTLAEYYIELGVFNFDIAPDESIRLLEHARHWNPGAERVPGLLWEAYMCCLDVARKHLDRGSLPDAEAIMSLVPDGQDMLSTELNNRGVAKLSRVYETVVSFHRRGIELSPAQRANFLPELLDAERLLLEAGRLRPDGEGIGENLEQIRELRRMLSPGAGGAYR